jgi:TP901 family phage tail tape measure protein
MNALMRIHIRVINQAKQELAQIRGDLAKVQAQQARSAGAQGALNDKVRNNHLEKYSKNLQWTGRQLEYNFTIPLLLAGGAATKFALDNEKAFTKVEKVYGDLNAALRSTYDKELPQLKRAFEELSNIFGVHQSEVINIAADWAAAGASGIALARQTRATLEAMIIGDMEAAEATKSLIAIQAQYNLSSKDLTSTLAMLNMVENQTATSMSDLIVAFTRSAGVARTYGVDARHLAAMISAIVPAAGNAERAGNALKTMLSRVMAPTNEAAEVMGLMGINVHDAGWQSLTASERILKMAEASEKLTQGQKAVVSSTVASRWNITAFDVLMRELVSNMGYYDKALESTADAQKNFNQYQREIGIYLASSPQAFKILYTQLQNAMSRVILPLIPALLALSSHAVRLVDAFTELSPATQQIVILLALLLAAVGPLARYIGAVGLLASKLGGALLVAGKGIGAAGAALMYMGKTFGTLLRLPFSALASGVGMVWRAFLALGSKRVLSAIAAPFRALVVGVGGPVLTLAAQMLAGIGGMVVQAGALMVTGWSGILGGLQAAHAGAVAGLKTIWGSLVFAAQFIWGAFVSVGQAAARALPMIHAVTTHVMYGIWLAFTGSWRTLMVALPVIMSSITMAMRVTWQFAHTAMAFISSAFVTVYRTLMTTIPVITQAVTSVLVATWRAATAAIVALWKALPVIASAVSKAIVFAFSNPWSLALLAVVAFVIAFRKQIGRGIQWMIDAWSEVPEAINGAFDYLSDRLNMFPEGVANVMRSVLRIIRDAALAIYDWLSYINPFARHSPSLVEQVQAGVDLIARKYASLSNIGKNFRRAISDLDAFGKATQAARAAAEGAERNEQRGNIVQVAGPGAGTAYDALAGNVDRLYDDLARVGREFAAQEAVVAKWKVRLDAANQTLQAAQSELDVLSARADQARNALDAAQERLDTFADTPIRGMRAMENAIFANEMAQKRLRLEMLRWEEVNGPLEDVENKLAAIRGDIEKLRGEAEGLRLSGAGSDITGPIEEQMAALQREADLLTGSSSPIRQIQDELAALERAGEILSLEQSLQFDPMLRQIEQLASGLHELPFDQIIAGMREAQGEVARLTPAWEAANQAQLAQQAVVDQLTLARDTLSRAYERENAKLTELGTAYDAIEGKIRDMESAMSDFASIADNALQKAAGAKLTPAGENFVAAGQGDFDIPGGEGILGREEGDIDALADQWAKEASQMFGDFDIFEPLKKMWADAITWLKENTPQGVRDFIETLKSNLSTVLAGAGIGALIGAFFGPWGAAIGAVIGGLLGGLIDTGPVQSAIATIQEVFMGFVEWMRGPIETVGGWLSSLWGFIGPDLERLFDMLMTVGGDAIARIAEEFRNWAPLGEDLMEALGHIGHVIGIILIPVIAALAILWKSTFPKLLHVARPVLDAIVGIFVGVFKIIRGIVTVFLAVINGDWGKAWDGIKTIFAGIWDTIFAVLKGAIGVVIGVVRGFVEGVIAAFTWLWDVLVGHSIVPDMVNAIIGWFEFLVTIASTIFTALVWVVTNIIIPGFQFLWNVAQVVFTAIAGVITWAWNNVIEPAWKALSWYITNVLAPWFKFLWDVIKLVWTGITTAISWAWRNVIQPIWNTIKWYIENVLKPIFEWLRDRLKDAWNAISDKIKTAWDAIKLIFEAIRTFVNEKLKPIWTELKDKFKTAWEGMRDVISNVWDTIKEKVRGGANVAIRAINALIRGIKKVVDVLPGDLSFDVSTIPELARGGNIPHSRVGGGFKTNGARAIVGEGKRGYPEYVVPTDPSHRQRAMNLFGRLGNDLGVPGYDWGGILPSPGDVIDTIKGTGERVARGLAKAAYEPISDAVNGQINNIPWEVPPRHMAKEMKNRVDLWVKGVDDEINAYADYQASTSNIGPSRGLNPEFLGLYNRYNHAAGGKFSITSGWRSYEEQVRLWNLYQAGIGNLAARPGTSNHEKGFAIDHSPHSTAADRVLASKYGLHYPVRSEMWHVEPKNIGALAAAAANQAHYGYGSGSANVREMAQKLLEERGWASHWGSLDRLVTHESSWNPNAQNPTSSAYGLFQFLNGTWGTVGGSKTSDPYQQLVLGLRYIAQRYGNPSAAWDFWQRNHWYESGGLMPSVASTMFAGKFAQGGSFTVPHRPGGVGVSFVAGEGGQDEHVTVTRGGPPPGAAGGTTNIFHGDLVFPNVTDGDDAEDFIRRLEAMADD